jgi:cell division protein FtsN
MKNQRGGFFLGLIVGLLIGLALALGVALYISKVPVPFVNKVPQRTPEQDAAEAEKNKNWDPNSSLYGKNPARPSGSASGTVTPLPGASGAASAPAAARESASAPAAPTSTRDPAAILADKPGATASAPAVSTAAAPDPFTYFVQAGAYSRSEEAEQQRAKLAMMGLTAKITEREQSGRTWYRVRVGPFDSKDAAGQAKQKLDAASIENDLVRVQKQP